MADRNPSFLPRLLFGVAMLVIAGAIATGLNMTGGPAHQRLIRLDETRIRDLDMLTERLRIRYQRDKNIPTSLQELDGSLPKDPTSHANYDYRRMNDKTFKLCARFDTKTDELDGTGTYYYAPHGFREHPKGLHCFEQTAVWNGP